MLEGLTGWLDAEKWRFWFVALTATAAWMAIVIAPWRRTATGPEQAGASESRWHTIVWLAATMILLLAWRWPYLLGPHILNLDEAQMLAGAITLKQFPVFWKYVDGTTHGPLTHLALVMGNALGLPLNYGGARFLSGLLVLGGLVIASRGLMHRYHHRAVRIGLAPAMLLYASVAFYDFTGYTSETVPLFLILAASGLLLSSLFNDRATTVSSGLRCFAAGLCLGSLPFAKLQSVPAGLMLGLIGIVAIVARSKPMFGRQALITAGSCLAGALTPAIVVAIYLWIWGLGRQFWITYIDNNILYAGQAVKPYGKLLAELWEHIYAAPGLQTLTVVTFAVILFAMLFSTFRVRLRRVSDGGPLEPDMYHVALGVWKGLEGKLWISLAWLAFGAGSVASVISPGRQHGHYLQFLVPALALGLAIWIGELATHPPLKLLSRTKRLFGSVLLLGLVLGPILIARAYRADPDMHGLWTRNRGEWRTSAGLAIKALAQPGDTLSVWGWMPYFYVEADLPQATREAHTYGQIMPFPLQSFYRQRFLRDFARSSPRIFVDGVGGDNFGFKDRAAFAHETFPELADIISREFELVDEITESRIYLRKGGEVTPGN